MVEIIGKELLDYDNQTNLCFDKPLKFKNIEIYPLKVDDYMFFKSCIECLTINPFNTEKDIKLINLPYLTYIYEKQKTDGKFQTLGH